ncbi:MAG: DUF2961 domain-containing protein [Acidobacteria bacterium]|nr:DUF2961 domain-containing protein [Acidobacteriota bacterium]
MRILLVLACLGACAGGELYQKKPGAQTRWSSFENPKAAKGAGGASNHGAKGRAFEPLEAGQTKTLLDFQGSGVVRRIWITIPLRDPQMLRSLRLDMYWDNARTPAVSVPFGDFFGAIHGSAVRLENELFSNPEGRSFNCYIPMPFRTAARITVTNESGRDLRAFFYDVDLETAPKPDPEALFFHAWWHRDHATELGRDFEILPAVRGQGRFLGAHVGVIAPEGIDGWWGEGEVKMYLDGDSALPTIVGTGTEDYIGTGWGQGLFQSRYQGSLVSDQKSRQYAFYRYHVPDPVYFHQDARITLQQIGGNVKSKVVEMVRRGAAIRPISVSEEKRFTPLLESGNSVLDDPAPADAWVNFYESQDVSAVALFYLDRSENGLGRLAPALARTAGLPQSPAK